MQRKNDHNMPVPTDIQELQNIFQKNPIDLHLKVETGDEETAKDDAKACHGQNQRLHLGGSLKLHLKEALYNFIGQEEQKKCHIIIVVDCSGSMAGNPFNQVKMALEEIIGQILGDENRTVDVILYNNKAVTFNYSPEGYKDAIKKLNPGGTTSFKAAFDETEAVLRRRKDEHFDETVIMFMTDGKDTVSGQSLVNEYSKKWKKNLLQMCEQITVHVIGFSADHDLNFLRRISLSGSIEGLYRYSEPSDGPKALKEKLEELFEYVNLSDGYPIKFELSLENPKNTLVLLGSHSGQVDGVLNILQKDDKSDIVASMDCWIFVPEPDDVLKITVGIEILLRKKRRIYTFIIPCKIASQEKTVIKDEHGKALWNLSVFSRDTDLLSSRISQAVTSGKVDCNELKKTLDQLQDNLSRTKVYRPEYDKATRAEIMNTIKDIQPKLDLLHGMLAQLLRGETQDVSLLARAHDLRFETKFSKARRQRLMDRRVAQNFKAIKSDAQKANTISEEEITMLSKEAIEFYFCILSLASVKDILLDSSDLQNAIGLGLAVTRPELVLDNPTSIQIWSISGALVSRSSLMDAFEFKIGVDGPLATHGGFSFKSSDNDDTISHATVGASREPINAWLPLFITPAHWTRVKSCLKQSLGYLCTLDPLGYDDKQLDIFYMILGHMIGLLSEKEVTENQLRLIFAMQRTCRACMNDFNLKESIMTKVSNFLKSPMGRFKNEIPNLFTLIGYLVTLPVSDIKTLLEQYTDDTTIKSRRLWLGILTELVRRSVSNSAVASDAKVISILNLLLHGSKAPDQEEFSSTNLAHLFGQYSWQMATNQIDSTLDIPEYDPAEGEKPPEIAIKHSAKVDKAMAVWAEYFCCKCEGEKGSARLSEAKGIVKKWIEKVRLNAGLSLDENMKRKLDPVIDICIELPPYGKGMATGGAMSAKAEADKKTQDQPKYDCTMMNLITLRDTAKILKQLSEHCFPRLASLPGCIGFLECWLTLSDSLDDIETLPSVEWIQRMKDAVQAVYSKINDFKKSCEGESLLFEFNEERANNGEEENIPHGVHGNKELSDESYLNQNRNITEQIITLPMILSALGINQNQLQLIRALLCQSIAYCSNSQAREATENGQFLDLTEEGNDQTHLSSVEANLVERKEAIKHKMAQKAAWHCGNLNMIQAESVWAFIGYLLKTHKDRGEGFKELIEFILNSPNGSKIPLLAEKILVLLTGKYQGHIVFARGNVWIPEIKLCKQLEMLIGEEAWANIEVELLSNAHDHVYRESDIPNRQGHCNSNPYIPDRIRKLKGLPLLEELPPNPNRRKGRKK